ncbi:MAG: hypothetical protein AAGU23_06935, partial [Bacillota bacterium]
MAFMDSFANTFLRTYLAGYKSPAEKQKEEYERRVYEAANKLFGEAQKDMNGTIDVNKNYDPNFKPLNINTNADSYKLSTTFGKDKEPSTADQFAQKLYDSEKAKGKDTTWLTDMTKPQEMITYRKPLNTQDWLKKNGWLLGPAGFKSESLQMGMLSPDENYQAARIGGKLDLSAKESADVQNDYFKQLANNIYRTLEAADRNYRTAVEYGGNNDLTQNLNAAIQYQNPDLGGIMRYQSYPNLKGTKVMTAESQVNRDNAAANSSNSTAWRNYNNNPNAGGGGSTGNGYSKNDNTYFHKYENQGGLDQDLALLSTYQPTGAEYTTAQQTAFNKASVRVKTYNKWKYGDPSGPAGGSDFQANLSGPGGQAKSTGLNNTFGKVEISQAEYDSLRQQGFTDEQIQAEAYVR